jgi:ParB-like chromosome segregation protein Spo0J
MGKQLAILELNNSILNKDKKKSPVYNVKSIPINKIRANSYNPNSVAPPEMKLLETSIWEDGYTMPIVCYYIPKDDVYEIVDGYHRYTTMIRSKR